MDKNKQVVVQQEVFGEKQILKMASFLQADFKELDKFFAGVKTGDLTTAAQKTGDLNDLADTLDAVRGLKDLVKKSQIVNKEMVLSKDKQEKQALEKENAQIRSYENLAAISIASNEILLTIKDAALNLTGMLVKLTNLTDNVKKITHSRVMRGILGFGKDD
jgi:hypothetical protein